MVVVREFDVGDGGEEAGFFGRGGAETCHVVGDVVRIQGDDAGYVGFGGAPDCEGG